VIKGGSNPLSSSLRIQDNMNSTCFMVRLLFKALYAVLHGQTPDLITYEVKEHTHFNECSYCGAKIDDHCPQCDQLQKLVKLHFESFLI
jgi:hypothetical protein